MLACRPLALSLVAAAAAILTFTLPASAAPCTLGSECSSTFCVDGQCCDTECAGACSACSAAKKGSGDDGICGPIADGQDPDQECPAQSCDAGTVDKAQVCDGLGACRSDGTTPCDPYLCAGTACAATCQHDTDCAASAFCENSQCTADLDAGASCTDAGQCKTGFCADGVCCDAACTGTCEACTAALKGAGADGACEPVADGTDPRDGCAPDPGYPASCKADGMCDGSGACRTAAMQGVACGATTCTGGTISGLICDGQGTCATSNALCSPYVCDDNGEACRTDCTYDGHCAYNFFCGDNGTCRTVKPIGSYCASNLDCESGFCVDSVCCASACEGQCQACDGYPAGQCKGIYGIPHGERPACPGQGSACGAVCDPTAGACVYPFGADCGSTCSGGAETRRQCDGNGTCVSSPSVACGAYQCVGVSCAKSCTSGYECLGGYGCVGGACMPGTAVCTSDGLSVSPVQGDAYSCAPYTCWNGACRTVCAQDDDCVSGYVCQSTKCVTPTTKKQYAPGVAEEDGCAMHAGAARSPAPALLLLLLLLLGKRRQAEPRA